MEKKQLLRELRHGQTESQASRQTNRRTIVIHKCFLTSLESIKK